MDQKSAINKNKGIKKKQVTKTKIEIGGKRRKTIPESLQKALHDNSRNDAVQHSRQEVVKLHQRARLEGGNRSDFVNLVRPGVLGYGDWLFIVIQTVMATGDHLLRDTLRQFAKPLQPPRLEHHAIGDVEKMSYRWILQRLMHHPIPVLFHGQRALWPNVGNPVLGMLLANAAQSCRLCCFCRVIGD